MWRPILTALAAIFALEVAFELARKSPPPRDEQKRFEAQLDSLRQRQTQAEREIRTLNHELTLLRDKVQHNRETAALQMENQRLKLERRLPPRDSQ